MSTCIDFPWCCVPAGLPRLTEIINLAKNIKTPSLKVRGAVREGCIAGCAAAGVPAAPGQPGATVILHVVRALNIRIVKG
jgi:hypothetical protein